MSLDDDLTRSGRAIASSTVRPPPPARRLVARRRRARLLAGTAAALVLVAGVVGVFVARSEDRSTVKMVRHPPRVRIEAGHGETRVIIPGGRDLGVLPIGTTRPAADPLLDRVAGELLDDPAVVDALRPHGVTGDRAARADLLADAGLVVETTIRPGPLDAARGVAPGPDRAIVSVVPSTGEIVALAGPVSSVNDSAGPMYFPIVMAAALESGVGPDERIPAPGRYTVTRLSQPWTVSNIGRADLGDVTLAEAVAESAYTPWAVLFDQGRLDPARVAEVARRLGITARGDAPASPSAVIGADALGPVELAGAYATLANGGRPVDAHVVRRVLDGRGAVLYDATTRVPAPGSGLDPRAAAQVRAALQQAICCGRGSGAALGGSVAQFGQYAEMQNGTQAWFAGSTPDLTTVVWSGHADDGVPGRWRNYMDAVADPGHQGFPG